MKIPVKDLKPGAKVLGQTIAEMGSVSRPMDMVFYRKDGHEYILMSNTTRGVMKFQADNLGGFKPITPPERARFVSRVCSTQVVRERCFSQQLL